MTTILAADTSTSISAVAVCRGEQGKPITLCAETIIESGRRHAERLLGTVDWVLREAEIQLEEIDALAISQGPGSFTGLRIGVATWKGLAFAHGLPLAPVPTLDALSLLGASFQGVVCSLLDARMGEVYSAAYRYQDGRRDKIVGQRVCAIEQFIDDAVESDAFHGTEPVLFLGGGAILYQERIHAKLPHARIADTLQSLPRASAVAAEAMTLLAAGATTDAALVSPVYLRKSQAELNLAAKEGASGGAEAGGP